MRKKGEYGIRKKIIAPNPAPAEIPSNPGSARLFLRSVCRMMPEQDNAAPISIAFSVLGRRMSRIILRKIPESLPEYRSPGEIITLPVETESINEIIKTTKRINNIFKFRLNILIKLIFVAKNKNILTNKG
jgi:hypothetical protein